MPILSHPAFGPKTALGYVTGGSLLCIWTLVWYFTIGQHRELTDTTRFFLIGLVLTGVTFVFLGLTLGPLGRAARQAELPPADALHAEAVIQQTAAAHLPGAAVPAAGMPVAGMPAAPMAAAPMAPVVPAPVAPAR